MAFGQGMDGTGRGPARLLALLVLAIALGLLAWRGASLLTRPAAPAAANPAEAALADIIAPVAGPGLSRLSVSYNAEGGRTVLILLDETAAARIPELERIAPLAAGLIPERGDRLIIETVTFAAGLPGRPQPSAWLELAGLGLLVLFGGALAFLTAQPAPVQRPSAQTIAPVTPPTERLHEAPRPIRPVAAPAPETAASDLARRDPARAAAVVRGWLAAKDDAV